MPPPPPKVALVLGSGGARGWAHIGVIRALLEAGIRPDLIVGSSIGAILGAILAADRFDLLLAWLGIRERDAGPEPAPRLRMPRWQDFRHLPRAFDRGGLVSGRLLLLLFRDFLRDIGFDALATPFAAVATDLWREEAVTLTEGPVLTAVAASSAVPGLFKPVRIGGRLLLDGGLTAPIPVAQARALGAGLVIASDINSPAVRRAPETDAPAGIAALCAQTWRLVENRLSELALRTEPPDLLIRPATGHIHTLDFIGGQELQRCGYEAAAAALPQLRKMLTPCTP